MTYPTRPKGGSDPAVTRGVLVLIVVALVGIILLAGSGSFTAKNSSSKKQATTTGAGAGGSTTTATTTTAPTPTTHQATDVKVLVLNGTGGQNPTAGSQNTAKLTGYTTLAPLDTATSASSAVYFTSGYEADAKSVAKMLGIADTAVAAAPASPLSADPEYATANVLVVIGTDQSSGSATSTGGTSTGGASTGGTSTGATSTGGTSTGASGTSTGGTSTGGTGTTTGGTSTTGGTGTTTG